MIRALSLSELASRCGVSAPTQDVMFTSVSTDSRQVRRGDLFVALRGDRFDGHDYVSAVEQAGACAAVVERKTPASLPQLVVDNTVHALGELGALNRDQFSGIVFAMTGSSGKTTVKEMLTAILSLRGNVLATRGNFNNHIGVPLTLLQIRSEHDFAVIEMGASAVGEIAHLARIARPRISVVNNVGTAHLEGFGSVANIAKGKGEIYQFLGKDGVAVINGDDAFRDQWQQQNAGRRCVQYSVNRPADVYATDIVANDREQYAFRLHWQGTSVTVQLALIGRHNVANALAAASCALAAGIDLAAVQQGLASARAVTGRLCVLTGVNGASVIDDTYNANPGSVRAAIEALASMRGRRILVLGAMAELGSDSARLHAEVGAAAKSAGVHALLATGELTRHAVQGFGAGAQHFPDQATLATACRSFADSRTIFLVKGSRSAAMENVVQLLAGDTPATEKTAC